MFFAQANATSTTFNNGVTCGGCGSFYLRLLLLKIKSCDSNYAARRALPLTERK